MKNYSFIACASFVFLNLSFSTAFALGKTVNPNTGNAISNQSPASGCVTFKINPKRLYAPFKLKVRTNKFTREFLFEDGSDRVFDKFAEDSDVLADSTLIINYIDRKGRVVQGENEAGRASGSSVDCSPQVSLDFGLKATAGSFEFLNDEEESSAQQRAEAYYLAIDPNEEKTTLQDWKRANGFFVANKPTQLEEAGLPNNNLPRSSVVRVKPKTGKGVRQRSNQPSVIMSGQVEPQDNRDDASVKYFNHGDLGFGRDMHMKRTGKNNNNLAFYVTNYRSMEDTINRDDPIATVAMEYSYGSKKRGKKERYVQFYVYNGQGDRIESADLDGRGEKFLPNLCMTCHGGELVKPIPPATTISPVDSIPVAGDLGARFLPFDLNAFDYSESDSAYTQAAQEAAFKTMNLSLLDAFPTSAMIELIEGWYTGSAKSFASQQPKSEQAQRSTASKKSRVKAHSGSGIHAQSEAVAGVNLPSEGSPILNRSTQRTEFVPVGWRGVHEELYTEIVAPYCRGCHITRGASLDWSTHNGFIVYGGVIRNKVCQQDAETMPNAKATYQNMWLSSVDPIDVLTRHGIFTLGANDTCGQGPWARP